MERKYIKGYTLAELIVVMAIMAILGTTLLTMMNTGGKLYRNANAIMEEQSNSRLAMSYITMRIRQNDVKNNINIANVTVDGKLYRALTIADSSNSNRSYWIYIDTTTGKLKELIVTSTSTSVSDIADVSNFTIKKLVSVPSMPTTIRIEITSKDGTIHLNEDLTLRSPQQNLPSEN
ncbi:hypothetical protein DP73_16760 [Desulfosporosinus sp. HMP52]|nr:hypothetical protein DP73_16760 [Desulfosporosinus sp. HMP52]